MDWTAEAIDQLRSLWDEGHSTAEIGRRMGVSKNAVVGKAHRLNLPARPSPIRREAEGSPRPAAQPRRTLPVREAVSLRRPEPAPAAPPAPTPVPAVVRPFPRIAARSCCWPMGEPGTPEFRFCAAPAMAPKPYCAEHVAIAYVKVRDRREDAA
jgi:GcrA cell cycle regulator